MTSIGMIAIALLCQQTAPLPALSSREVFSLVNELPAEFERKWEERFQAVTKDAQGDALSELRAARARGYIDYSYFHWRETGAAVPEPWTARRRAEAAVALDDVKGLDRREHRAFLDSWLRAEARARLASDGALKTGDNRWLRARFAVVEARVREPLVRRRLLYDAIATHIDDNGARGVPDLLTRFV